MNELEVLKNSLNISVWMLGVTVFLSVSTVTISAINMAFQRSHNRKSVKPFCNVHTLIDGNGICVSILNAGLGPMIIEKIMLFKKEDDFLKNGMEFSAVLPPDLKYDIKTRDNNPYVVPSMVEVEIFRFSSDLKDYSRSVLAVSPPTSPSSPQLPKKPMRAGKKSRAPIAVSAAPVRMRTSRSRRTEAALRNPRSASRKITFRKRSVTK